ncbi:MAG: 4a-hydroxytetrahydrobiopterin dehydratase [Gammaproteobacteria bacterium]|nr:4a-hydroxytetrahydrobiopterin dehydratase [Gammaproteobacteria bacterium]
MSDLDKKHCVPCEGGASPLDQDMINEMMKEIHCDWQLNTDNKEIQRLFKFGDFHKTMDFVNKVANIAHDEDHHPDMEVSYSKCLVRYSTHAVGGLSINDFICAARIDLLVE